MDNDFMIELDEYDLFLEGKLKLHYFDTNTYDDFLNFNDAIGNFGNISFFPNKVDFFIHPIGTIFNITHYSNIEILYDVAEDFDIAFGNSLVTVKLMNSNRNEWWELKFEAETENAIQIYKQLESFINVSASQQCFVATAVYGDHQCEQIVKLRRWRDAYLIKSNTGRQFVKFYYRHGEYWAKAIEPYPALKGTIKFGLNIFTRLIR